VTALFIFQGSPAAPHTLRSRRGGGGGVAS